MNKHLNGIDTVNIILDSDGRYELEDLQLMRVTGGEKETGPFIPVHDKRCKPSGPIVGHHCIS